MRVVRQGVEDTTQVLVDEGVAANSGIERLELLGRRQLTVNQEPGCLEKSRVRGDIGDVVPAVAQDALVTVDIGDRTLGGRRVNEPHIECGEARLFGEGRDINGISTVHRLDDGELGANAAKLEDSLLGGSVCSVGHSYSINARAVNGCILQ